MPPYTHRQWYINEDKIVPNTDKFYDILQFYILYFAILYFIFCNFIFYIFQFYILYFAILYFIFYILQFYILYFAILYFIYLKFYTGINTNVQNNNEISLQFKPMKLILWITVSSFLKFYYLLVTW